MDTLELEPKSSLDPILNYSTSSEASSVVGNIGPRLSQLENISIENETILSKCTNGSIDNVREQNVLRFCRRDRNAKLSASVENSINLSFSYSKNFELSSELERLISLENSDLSILMKSRNSAIKKRDILKHFYKINHMPLANTNETLNDTKINLTLSSQEKKMESDKKFYAQLKLDNNHSKKHGRSSTKQSNNTTIDIINIKNEFRENTQISSGLEKKSCEESNYENSKMTLNRTNYEFSKSSAKTNFYRFSDSEDRKKNILKNKLKHCEVKLFDYLVEQETHEGRYIDKNELLDKVFNKAIHSSTKEKEQGDTDFFIEDNSNNNVSIRGKDILNNNLIEKNISLIENSKENIKEFINYLKKSASLDYELDKSNLYQCTDNFLHESNFKILNNEKDNFQDNTDKNYEIFNYKTKTELTSTNVEPTKKDVKNNIYFKYRKLNKLKFKDECVVTKISHVNKISDNKNDKNKQTRSTTLYESDDYSTLEEDDPIADVTDRVSSRLRKMHGSKLKCSKPRSLPKKVSEEEIKKVVHNITSSLVSSKNNIKINKEFKEKKSKTNNINGSDIRIRLRKCPQNIKRKNQIKTQLNIPEIRKFIISKLPDSSKSDKLLETEDIIEKLNITIRNSESRRHNINNIIMTLQELLFENNICTNYIEFYTFISNFTPYCFQKKVMPLGGAFGCNGPKVTKKLCDPLL